MGDSEVFGVHLLHHLTDGQGVVQGVGDAYLHLGEAELLASSGIVSITVSEYYRLGEQGTVRLEDRADNQITVQVVQDAPKRHE